MNICDSQIDTAGYHTKEKGFLTTMSDVNWEPIQKQIRKTAHAMSVGEESSSFEPCN